MIDGKKKIRNIFDFSKMEKRKNLFEFAFNIFEHLGATVFEDETIQWDHQP
jgi:hypothetical protein